VSGIRSALERGLLRALSVPAASRLTGRLSDARLPPILVRAVIRAYSSFYGVDWSEVRDPVGSFRTFNAFFVRRLRNGARPVAQGPGVVVSPCDARLSAWGPVPEDGRLEQVKGMTYALEALLGSAEEAERFRGGVYATLYLSPGMYHRVHSPVDGRICAWRYLPGRLFPVNGLALPKVEGLFTRNERVAVTLQTEAFGLVAVVLVGATNVGRITLAFTDLVTNRRQPSSSNQPAAPIRIARGEDLGVFNLGSTVVLLVADGSLRPFALGDHVRMGQALWGKA
jgi:phosphatidylserine decarboxylase